MDFKMEQETESNSDYLSHHGILGQKWGVRRYQNKDGTLTAEGKRKLGLESKANRKVTFDASTGDIDPGDIDKANSIIREYASQNYKDLTEKRKTEKQLADNIGNLYKSKAAKKKAKAAEKMDLSDLSDKDLQDIISRYNLERQVKSIATGNMTTHADKMASRMDTVGSLLAIGVSAATLASIIHNMRK